MTPAKYYATRKDFRKNFGNFGILDSFFGQVFKHIERTLKEEGFFYVFCNSDTYPLFYYYSFTFTRNARAVVWDKKVSINGYSWRHQHELILFGEMPKAEPIKTGDGDVIRMRAVPIDDRTHPAQKPSKLIQKLIKKNSSPNDFIADFFAGSGVVLKEAKRLGRNYFGIEYDEGVYNTSRKALKEIDFKSNLKYTQSRKTTLDSF